MYYAGMDYHKRYSVVGIQAAQGQIVREERVDHASPEEFRRLFRECREPVSIVCSRPSVLRVLRRPPR